MTRLARLKSYLLFERWTLLEPDAMLRRRATWPRWRRMLRPIGATVWWLGVVVNVVVPRSDGARVGTWQFALGLVMTTVLVVCIVAGTGLEWRDRRRERRRVVA